MLPDLQQNDRYGSAKLRRPDVQTQNNPTKKKRKLLSFGDQCQPEDENLKIRKSAKAKAQNGPGELKKTENLESQLREQYYREMQRLREELIEIEYSYWDGPNVIKKIRRKKKDTVKQLLEVCRLELIENFQNVALVEAKQLIFVIKDFIAPHEISLADIEILKLQTAKEDLLLNLRHVKIKKQGKDITLSVNLDGPARIIQKSRYEANKSRYPFCNWQTLNFQEMLSENK